MKGFLVSSAVLAGSLLLAGCGTATSGNVNKTSGSQSTPVNAQVVAVQATDWSWKLDKTSFRAGQPIEFDITGMEGVHGFSIDGTGISQQIIQGKTTKVVWTPPQPGTYIIRCNIYCGTGHDGMTTTFTVQ